MGQVHTAPRTPTSGLMFSAVMRFTRWRHCQLLATGDAELIEHTRNDRCWADGGDGKGANHLGRLLMKGFFLSRHVGQSHNLPLPFQFARAFAQARLAVLVACSLSLSPLPTRQLDRWFSLRPSRARKSLTNYSEEATKKKPQTGVAWERRRRALGFITGDVPNNALIPGTLLGRIASP